MTFTISFGWWFAPAAVTFVAFLWRWWVHKDDGPAYGYGQIGASMAGAVTFLFAAGVSLLAWLIWALLT